MRASGAMWPFHNDAPPAIVRIKIINPTHSSQPDMQQQAGAHHFTQRGIINLSKLNAVFLRLKASRRRLLMERRVAMISINTWV